MISNIPTHYLQKVIILLVILALVQLGISQAYAQTPNDFKPGISKGVAIDYAKSSTETFVYIQTKHKELAYKVITNK